MAVRDDFSAGEVLAAADLNDTFAAKLPYSYGTATPSTTTDGFLWYDENDTPPTPKFWDGSAFQNVAEAGGLVQVATATASADSSVSINGCFTSTYTNYRIVTKLTTSGNAYINYRLRASGSDASGSNYNRQSLQGLSSTASAFASASNTLGYLNINQHTGLIQTSVDIFGPQVAAATGFSIVTYSAKPAVEVTGTEHTLSTAYDGITIFASTGTITGSIFVYGYKD